MTKVLVGLALLAMSEDVEIMRQIVEQAVNVAYFGDAPRLQANSRPGAGPAHAGIKDATGVYLPGYGVLIQLTAPGDFAAARAREFDPGGRLISQWEAARQKLRGAPTVALAEPSSFGKAIQPPTREELTGHVLDVLADNGHNFRELSSNERLTVDVVFRDRNATRCAVCHDGGASSMARQPRAAASGLAGVPAGLPPSEAALEFLALSQVKSADENAGDLHMRQKNYAKAIEAYQKALKAAPGMSPNDKVLLSLYQKLAQAQVAAGLFKDAERLLKTLADSARSSSWRAQLDFKGQQIKQPDSPAAKLPAHLIISATKSQLDAVAEGKMSRDEFAKAARVDYLDPRAAAVTPKGGEGEPSKGN